MFDVIACILLAAVNWGLVYAYRKTWRAFRTNTISCGLCGFVLGTLTPAYICLAITTVVYLFALAFGRGLGNSLLSSPDCGLQTLFWIGVGYGAIVLISAGPAGTIGLLCGLASRQFIAGRQPRLLGCEQHGGEAAQIVKFAPAWLSKTPARGELVAVGVLSFAGWLAFSTLVLAYFVMRSFSHT